MTFSPSSLFFFFTTLVLLSTQIHARDSYFFGKFQRGSPKDQNPNHVAESIPNEKEQEHDPSFVPESENGYGLYGHETSYNNKEEFNNNKYDDSFNGKTFSTPSLSETEESYNNNYDEKYPKKTESYYNNGYNNEEFDNNNNKYDEDVKEESFSENNEDKNNFYNTEQERETPYKGYNHNLERQGMSDTRFMAKGNYYYDLNNDRNHGHFYRKTHQKSPSGYYSSPATTENYENNNNNYNEEKPEEFVEEQGNYFKP